MRSPQHSRPARAFTLVELLVVIAIIAILASLITSVLGRGRVAANETKCASALRQLQAGSITYANDNDGEYVPVNVTDANATGTHWYSDKKFLEILNVNTKNPDNWLIPDRLLCPLAVKNKIKVGYGENYTGLGGSLTQPNSRRSVTIQKVARPQESIAFMDGLDWQVQMSGSNSYVSDVSAGGSTCSYRHDNSAYIAFFDGHVAKLSRKEIANNAKLWNILE